MIPERKTDANPQAIAIPKTTHECIEVVFGNSIHANKTVLIKVNPPDINKAGEPSRSPPPLQIAVCRSPGPKERSEPSPTQRPC